MSFLKLVPSWVWIALALVAAGVYYGHTRYEDGKDAKQREWTAAIERGRVELEKLKKKQVVVTTKIETVTVEKIRTIHVKGDTIVKLRDRFVPVDSGSLAGGFRLFYDGAATSTVPDPAGIADAAPVAVADVATSIAGNFERCHVAYAVVEGWQKWVQEQQKLNP